MLTKLEIALLTLIFICGCIIVVQGQDVRHYRKLAEERKDTIAGMGQFYRNECQAILNQKVAEANKIITKLREGASNDRN